VSTTSGAVAVPENPSRVVVLGAAELDSALTLGLTPVGAARAPLDTGLPGYFPPEWLASVADVGPIGSPDLAAIARLRPDLILGNRTDDAYHYARLAAIAPTVLTASTGAGWKQDFQLHAQALNRQTFADATTAAFEDHLRQFTGALGGSGNTRRQQVSLLRFVQDEDPRVYATQNFLGSLLSDAQVGRPAAQNVAAFEVLIPTTADLGDADGTALLWSTYGDPAKAQTQAFTTSAAWRQLGAVKAHRAFRVADELWFVGVGYFAANLVLAQLQRFLGA
jgi:iron complex transport system substrate-binding protein